MFLRFDENENCGFVDDRVFTERSEAKEVSHVLRRRGGDEKWCAVTGLDEQGAPIPAMARKVEDSGEGICFLVYGGKWGLRLKDPACADAWSLTDPHQWGEGFLLLPASGEDVRFLT
jgi:hypothetical protein